MITKWIKKCNINVLKMVNCHFFLNWLTEQPSLEFFKKKASTKNFVKKYLHPFLNKFNIL